jgi:hypothetical protein
MNKGALINHVTKWQRRGSNDVKCEVREVLINIGTSAKIVKRKESSTGPISRKGRQGMKSPSKWKRLR